MFRRYQQHIKIDFSLIYCPTDYSHLLVPFCQYLSCYWCLYFPTDLEKLSTFSQRFPLPSMYRIHVWKVLLGKTHTNITYVTIMTCISEVACKKDEMRFLMYKPLGVTLNNQTLLFLQESYHRTVTLTFWWEATGRSSTRISWRLWRWWDT